MSVWNQAKEAIENSLYIERNWFMDQDSKEKRWHKIERNNVRRKMKAYLEAKKNLKKAIEELRDLPN